MMFTAWQQSCEKVVHSLTCVCLSTGEGENHVTTTHDALEITVQALGHGSSGYLMPMTCGGPHWRGDLFKVGHFRTTPTLVLTSGGCKL